MHEIKIKVIKSGLYIYRDIESGKIVYIGKDSDLRTNRRHYDHNREDFKTGQRGQKINQVLQDNPTRYAYEQLAFCNPEFMDALEGVLIHYYKPEFNILDNDDHKKSKKKTAKKPVNKKQSK